MKAVRLLIILFISFAGLNAMAFSTNKYERASYEKTIQLTQKFSNSVSAKDKTSKKIQAINDHLLLITHIDTLTNAYQSQALRQIVVLNSPHTTAEDEELAQAGLSNSIDKIGTLLERRRKLIASMNTLLRIGHQSTQFGSTQISFFEIPQPVKIEETVSSLL